MHERRERLMFRVARTTLSRIEKHGPITKTLSRDSKQADSVSAQQEMRAQIQVGRLIALLLQTRHG